MRPRWPLPPYSRQALGRMQRIKTFLVSNGSQNRELDQCQQNHGLTKSPLTAAIPRLSSGLATEVAVRQPAPRPSNSSRSSGAGAAPQGQRRLCRAGCRLARRHNRRADNHSHLGLPPPQARNIPRPRSDHARGRKHQVPCEAERYARRWAGRRAASSTVRQARYRAIRPQIGDAPPRVRRRHDAESLTTRTPVASSERPAPTTAPIGETKPRRLVESRARPACAAPPPRVRRPRAHRAQTRPLNLQIPQALGSLASRHCLKLASPRRIVDFIVPSGTANISASSACEKP